MGAEVFGISVDSWATHAEFRKQLGLPFDLLSDWASDVSPEYGAYDKVEMVSTRRSFLIDRQGKIRFIQQAKLTKARDHDAMMRELEKLADAEKSGR